MPCIAWMIGMMIVLGWTGEEHGIVHHIKFFPWNIIVKAL